MADYSGLQPNMSIWNKVSLHLGIWSIASGAIISAVTFVVAHFATISYVQRTEHKSISEDISDYEGTRDYYQTMIDRGDELNADEMRRFRHVERRLDHLYKELNILAEELR